MWQQLRQHRVRTMESGEPRASMLSSESMPLRERLLRRLAFWAPKMCFLIQLPAPLLLARGCKTLPLHGNAGQLRLQLDRAWAFTERNVSQADIDWAASMSSGL